MSTYFHGSAAIKKQLVKGCHIAYRLKPSQLPVDEKKLWHGRVLHTMLDRADYRRVYRFIDPGHALCLKCFDQCFKMIGPLVKPIFHLCAWSLLASQAASWCEASPKGSLYSRILHKCVLYSLMAEKESCRSTGSIYSFELISGMGCSL